MPEYVKSVIDTLHKNGAEAYIVGGCVRDQLLGITPADYDVCTDATPDKVSRVFGKTADTGIKHGTVTVITSDAPVEVTTFRTENSYKDFRHPDKVTYVTDVAHDLSRRDFTVNAMCYNDKKGLVDLFGGEEDLRRGILRAVGDPDLRFKEDALRILRLFRFCSTLGFVPEEKTLAAAKNNAGLLKNISAERIAAELFRLANGKHPQAVLPLFSSGALPLFKPDPDIEKIPLLPENENLRFFAFLNLSSDDLASALDFLKCSNAFRKYAVCLKEAIPARAESRADIKRLLSRAGDDIYDLFYYRSVINGEPADLRIAAAKDIAKKGEPYKISHLKIKGDDIAALGYSGKDIRALMLKLLDAVIENPDLNRKEELEKLILSN